MLKDWEKIFAQKIQNIAPTERNRAGVLLQIISGQARWDEYLSKEFA